MRKKESKREKHVEKKFQEREKALRKASEIFEQKVIPWFSNYNAALDIGTGSAYTAFTLAKHFKKVVSIDSESKCLKTAKIKAADKNIENIQFFQMDAHKLNFSDKSFDVVICRAAIHHFDDANKVLAEVYRVLKKEGFFVLMDFCFSKKTKDALAPLSRIREDGFRSYYNFHDYCDILENNDFSIEVIYTYTLPRDIQEWAAVAPENIQERIINAFLSLDGSIHKELRLHKEGDQYIISYRIMEIISKKWR